MDAMNEMRIAHGSMVSWRSSMTGDATAAPTRVRMVENFILMMKVTF